MLHVHGREHRKEQDACADVEGPCRTVSVLPLVHVLLDDVSEDRGEHHHKEDVNGRLSR